MLEAVLLDNDVVLKMCGFHAADQLISVTTHDGHLPALLKVATFSLGTQVMRSRSIPDRASAANQLAQLLDRVEVIEPTAAEIDFAAELEERAINLGLQLDSGESQLVAVLLHRRGPLIATGDKRAIVALRAVGPPAADGRVACFEQVVAAAITGEGRLDPMRDEVCKSRSVDTSIANCFSCSSPSVSWEDVMTGLRSYTSTLRHDTGPLLIASDDLVAITPKEDRVGVV